MLYTKYIAADQDVETTEPKVSSRRTQRYRLQQQAQQQADKKRRIILKAGAIGVVGAVPVVAGFMRFFGRQESTPCLYELLVNGRLVN